MHIKNAARAVTAVMSTGLRRAVILPVAAVALGAASLITPAVASASLPAACGGDVCFSLASIYGTFFAWAPNYAFFGHFELQTPEHTVLNSTPNQQWAAGQEYQFHAGDHNGYYCVTAWQLKGTNGYDKIGYTCMTVTQIR